MAMTMGANADAGVGVAVEVELRLEFAIDVDGVDLRKRNYWYFWQTLVQRMFASRKA
jgi:hypothetical protein